METPQNTSEIETPIASSELQTTITSREKAAEVFDRSQGNHIDSRTYAQALTNIKPSATEKGSESSNNIEIDSDHSQREDVQRPTSSCQDEGKAKEPNDLVDGHEWPLIKHPAPIGMKKEGGNCGRKVAAEEKKKGNVRLAHTKRPTPSSKNKRKPREPIVNKGQ